MAPRTRTEHPHIVLVHGAGGNEAVVKGTRLSVALIAGLLNRGETPDGILSLYPSLSSAALYDALSYYFDHKDAIDREIQAGTPKEVLEELRNDPEMVKVGPGRFRRRKPFGLRYAATNGRAILTFNQKRFRPLYDVWWFAGQAHSGIILSREYKMDEIADLLHLIRNLVTRASPEELENSLTYLQQYS